MILSLNVSWNELKEIRIDLGTRFYYAGSGGDTIAVYVACPVFYATTILTMQSEIDDFTDNYMSDAFVSDTSTGALARALSKKVSLDSMPVSIKSRSEPSFMQWTIVSHDYTDKTTWYQMSTQVTDESLTGTVGDTIFPSANLFWINPDSPKLYNQSYNRGTVPYDQVALWMPDGTLRPKSDFRPIITIDDVPQTSGYTINYATGTVTFSSTVSGVVKATYYKATTSDFILRPRQNVVWEIPRVEVNTTSSLILNGSTYFQYWRDPAFQYVISAYMLAEMMYQSFAQMQASATTGADVYPAMGGTGVMPATAENGWASGQLRGTDQIPVILPWVYRKPFVMKYSSNDVIRLFTTNDVVHLGADFLTATFYIEESADA